MCPSLPTEAGKMLMISPGTGTLFFVATAPYSTASAPPRE
jgi:hypothetical protein